MQYGMYQLAVGLVFELNHYGYIRAPLQLLLHYCCNIIELKIHYTVQSQVTAQIQTKNSIQDYIVSLPNVCTYVHPLKHAAIALSLMGPLH